MIINVLAGVPILKVFFVLQTIGIVNNLKYLIFIKKLEKNVMILLHTNCVKQECPTRGSIPTSL